MKPQEAVGSVRFHTTTFTAPLIPANSITGRVSL